MDELLRAQRISKSYNVPVLKELDLELGKGEIHALVGSNGAGKSTLARILVGLTEPNEGQLFLEGQPYSPSSRNEALEHGIVMVLQELNLINNLTIAENLFISKMPRRLGVIDYGQLNRQTAEALKRVGLSNLLPETPISELGIGKRQLIEIAGALLHDSIKLLILDEPTAALTDPEIEILFENIRRLKADGTSIIYISHRMEEIKTICDRVTVMRDGKTINTHLIDEVSIDEMVAEMAGDEIAKHQPAHSPSPDAPVTLRVEDLCAAPNLENISFSIRKGEVLGISGLVGSGRTETLNAILGVQALKKGKIFIHGKEVSIKSPSSALKHGISLIPEDRKEEGLLLDLSICHNTTLNTLKNYASASVLNEKKEASDAEAISERLKLKYDFLSQPVSSLSGGNQQKAVIARSLLTHSDILFFDEPTRGIDVPAKEVIYRLIDDLTAEGRSVLVVSSDLLELMSLSHRIIVLSDGKLTGEFTPENWSQEAITSAAFQEYL